MRGKRITKANPLEHREVQEWLEAVTERATTRKNYIRAMGRFMDFTGWTPKQMLEIKQQGLKQGNPKTEVESKIVAFLRQLQRTRKIVGEGEYSAGEVAGAKTALGSFFAFHGFQLPKKLIRLSTAAAMAIRVPEQAEIEAMINYAGGVEAKALLTVAAECPCRPRAFMGMEWSWLEPGWESKDAVHIQIPPSLRPTESGPKKFEPIAFNGRRGVQILKQLKAKQGEAKGRIWPYTPEWFIITPSRIYQRAVAEQAIRPSGSAEQPITLKSFRKYVFNAIDSARDISPEWRAMLKGRELGVEKYYSKENIEKLREVYKTKIFPLIWKAEQTIDEKRLQLDMAKRILKAAGLDADHLLRIEIAKRAPQPITTDEQLKILDDQIAQLGILKRPETGKEKKHAANGGKPFESKIVTEDELTSYLDEGWDLVRELSNGKIVIRRAAGE